MVGYPVLPLLRQLNEQIPEAVSKYLHFGATTQDVMDCAVILQIREGLQLIRAELTKLVISLSSLAQKYRDTFVVGSNLHLSTYLLTFNRPMAGRTHLQHALPITFGYKLSVFLFPLLTHLDRISAIQSNNLMVQFGGAAGTLASLGHDATKSLQVRSALAHELKLVDPPITWHAARDSLAEVLSLLALIGASLGKIAYDLIIMSSNEFNEVTEPFAPHRGASSTMPQKRNPVSSEIILATSRMLREKATLGLDAVVVDFERASGPWHLEWSAVPDAFVLLTGSLHQTNYVMKGLVVNEAAMRRNLMSSRGLIVSEAVMMSLAPIIGRQTAHDVVYKACSKAIDSDRSLLDVLMEDEAVMEHVSREKVAEYCDPLNYMGASMLQVDEVVKLAGQYTSNETV